MKHAELFNLIESERTKQGHTLKGFAKAIGSNKTSYNCHRKGTVDMGLRVLLNAFDVLGITITKVEKC